MQQKYVLEKACLNYITILDCFTSINITYIVHDKILKSYCLFSKFVKYLHALNVSVLFFFLINVNTGGKPRNYHEIVLT